MAQRNRKQRSVNQEKWRMLAIGGGKGGGVGGGPPAMAAGGGGPRDPSLTAKFNKAAKPKHAARTPAQQQQVNELRDQMRQAARQAGSDRAPNHRIASKDSIKKLQQKLSQPRNTWELTPTGSVTNSYDPKRDRTLTHEIKRQQQSLAKQKGAAMDGFNQAAGRSL